MLQPTYGLLQSKDTSTQEKVPKKISSAHLEITKIILSSSQKPPSSSRVVCPDADRPGCHGMPIDRRQYSGRCGCSLMQLFPQPQGSSCLTHDVGRQPCCCCPANKGAVRANAVALLGRGRRSRCICCRSLASRWSGCQVDWSGCRVACSGCWIVCSDKQRWGLSWCSRSCPISSSVRC